MNLYKNSSSLEDMSDASLVAASLGGDRQAFGKIVFRYQRLLCSLAYSSLGSLSESEDVAQETFVEAWRKLGSLREPDKLKAWLCGILKFKISRHRRKEARQPARNAADLHDVGELESNEERIEDVAMKQEEQALLWQALEGVPATYRETLILYYREHRSVEHVAHELDLSEDAVKQRLSRGRKLLKEKMMSFVEGALMRSSPSHVFTAGVLTALATVAPPAKAAGLGMAAAKVGTSFKWVSIVTFLASASGFVSSFFALRANLYQSRTKRERRAVVRSVVTFLAVAIAYVAGMMGLRSFATGQYEDARYVAVLAMGASAIGYKAYASLSALGWESAFSQSFSIAKDAAIGRVAIAEHVNNETAASISNLSTVNQSYAVILGIMAFLVIVPVVLYSNSVRKKMRRPFGDES